MLNRKTCLECRLAWYKAKNFPLFQSPEDIKYNTLHGLEFMCPHLVETTSYKFVLASNPPPEGCPREHQQGINNAE